MTPASDVDLGDTVTYTLTMTNSGEATATVEDDPALYNSTISNVAGFTSDNAGSGSAEAAFAVVTRYRILLPIIAQLAGVMP